MPLLFIDYTNLVIKDYEEKRKANSLSRLLMDPTTANIRQECLNVYHERINRGEIESDILRSFFGVPPVGRNFDHIIERHPADKFRPLRSLIKRETKIPSLVNVEMWAWLLDFNPRPLAYAQQLMGINNDVPNPSTLKEKSAEEENLPNEGREKLTHENPIAVMENKTALSKDDETATRAGETENGKDVFIKKTNPDTNNYKTKTIAAAGLLVTVLLAGIYGIRHYKGGKQTTFGNTNTGCMYWAYDHYEQVPCNEDRKGRLFLPLETEKIKSFRMITRKDTITEWSVGKIYYIKDDNKIVYYTEPGNFPDEINRTLKKLTRHIFEKDSANRKKPD